MNIFYCFSAALVGRPQDVLLVVSAASAASSTVSLALSWSPPASSTTSSNVVLHYSIACSDCSTALASALSFSPSNSTYITGSRYTRQRSAAVLCYIREKSRNQRRPDTTSSLVLLCDAVDCTDPLVYLIVTRIHTRESHLIRVL